MTWSNGKSGKGGNRYRKTKWTNPRPSRTTWVNYGYPSGAQRQGRQRGGGGSFVANRSYSQYNSYGGNGNPQRRKASSGPRRSYSGGGSSRVGYNTAKKAPAETFCVEVNTDNGDAVVFKDESVRASVVRLTDPGIPALLKDDFDGSVGFKLFTQDNRYITRNNGNFWQRQVVFTGPANIPFHQFTQSGGSALSHVRSPPQKLNDEVNCRVISRLFGQCNGPNTTIRVRDLLHGKASGTGLTILESKDVFNLQGKAGGATKNWPRKNSFTPTKAGARLKYRQRPNGAYGPELYELSAPHVYVLTIYVAGYEVLGLPVPLPPPALASDGSEDSFMSDMSGLSVGTNPQRGESSKKKVKVEKSEPDLFDVPAARHPMNVSPGNEIATMDVLETRREQSELNELFEVSHTSILRFYIYKK